MLCIARTAPRVAQLVCGFEQSLSSLSARALQVYPVLSLRLVSAWMDGDKIQLEELFCREPTVCQAFVAALICLVPLCAVAPGLGAVIHRGFCSFVARKKSASLGAPDRGFCARHGSARMCFYHLSTHLKGLT